MPGPAAAEPSPTSPTRVVELCVNLDDVSGEIIGHACEALRSAGALDVWTTPIHMKKHRPGVTLSVLCAADPPALAQQLAKLVLRLTGSFGVRYREWDRLVLDRDLIEAGTPLGPVTLKVGSLNGETLVVQPEFAAVQQLADRHGIAPREAFAVAQVAAADWLRRSPPPASRGDES